MARIESELRRLRIIFEDGPSITIPAIWQVHFRGDCYACITFLADGPHTYCASIVLLKSETAHLTAKQLTPDSPTYYTLEIRRAEPSAPIGQHTQVPHGIFPGYWCQECGVEWPCQAARKAGH